MLGKHTALSESIRKEISCSSLEKNIGDSIGLYKSILKKLNKTDQNLCIYDFDDFLYSRSETLKIPGLAANRGDDGVLRIIARYKKFIKNDEAIPICNEIRNKVNSLAEDVKNKAYKWFVNQYYSPSGKEQCLGLVNNFKDSLLKIASGDPYHTICTAGESKFQIAKIDQVGLSNNNSIIVNDSSMKPKTIVDKVISLGHIPAEVHVYDDRVNHFLEQGQDLANLLGTKIIIHKMMINDRNESTEIGTHIFKN